MDNRLSLALIDMNNLWRAPEPDVLASLLPSAQLTPDERERVLIQARLILKDLRANLETGWVNRFLQEYQLSSQEGIALLTLAEAYLRIPDAQTADLLIRDKLGEGDWQAHFGQSSSVLVNSATFGLVLTRSLIADQKGVLSNLLARLGEPVIRAGVATAMKMMGGVFVMGRTIDEALARASKPENDGFTQSFDMLGEAARTINDAQAYFDAYYQAILKVGAFEQQAARRGDGHSISVKLSALYPRYNVLHREACVPFLTDRLRQLALLCSQHGIGLCVDAEESERLMMSLEIIEAVARTPDLKGWEGFGMAVQAYGKRARPLIGWAQALAEQTRSKLSLRLVKGAYWDGEIKKAQVEGLSDYPLFTRKAATDVSYLACARDMFDATHLYPAFAGHNALTVATLIEWAGKRRDFEFQRLHGMGEGLHERLVRQEGFKCRTYAPVGGHKQLLAYLVRRLLENGANSSFVHQLSDLSVSEEVLLADPYVQIAAVKGQSHPKIVKPAKLFKDRKNSMGFDLNDEQTLARFSTALSRPHEPLFAHPLSGEGPFEVSHERPKKEVLNPATGALVGSVSEALPDDVLRAVSLALKAYESWHSRPIEERAACLERLAYLLEAHHLELICLLVKEAGKTLSDAVGELREAVDFCRYYAHQARLSLHPTVLEGPTGEQNELHLVGRGVFACISPWNFPLAIFIGQISAALVSGNAVIAKPAPQTPLIAFRCVTLAHQAGIPKDVLHFLPGGVNLGQALTSHKDVHGVSFTGSMGTARAIARSLVADDHRPLVPLIAETGGLNAMIVDSSALPEQVVNDVIISAFQSAGQRCSALRLLIIQDDVYENIIDMLKGAMDTLILGDPQEFSTDIGPVIDAAARDKLEAYRQSVKHKWLHTVELGEQAGSFVAPTLIEVEAIEALDQEWFGPLLHVTKWQQGGLEDILARINAKRYGLTMGLHSRISSVAECVSAKARVGNLYINRSMIGAVVGSQPFGGEGLSGTGPKAGGPHYLHRFVTERTISTDTTSAGGNASLLSLAET